MLVEGVCFEHFRHLLIQPGYELVDGLLPGLLLIALVVDCIKKVPQRFLDDLSEDFRKLSRVMDVKREGLVSVSLMKRLEDITCF